MEPTRLIDIMNHISVEIDFMLHLHVGSLELLRLPLSFLLLPTNAWVNAKYAYSNRLHTLPMIAIKG